MILMDYLKLNPIIKKFIIVVFMYGLTSAAFNGFFGIYVKELGHPESAVGSILSLRRLSVGISTFLITYISSRIGQKKTLMLGLIIVGLSSITIVLSESLPAMKLISIIYGFGQAAMLTIESPFIYEQSAFSERVHAFSLAFAARNAAFMSGSLFTGFLSDLIRPYLSSNIQSIRYAIIFVSCFSMLVVVPLAVMNAKESSSDKPIGLNDLTGFISRQNILFILYTGIIGMGAGMVVPFFGVYLKYMLETSESVVGLILSFAQLGNVFGGLSVPRLTKKIGREIAIIVSQLLSIPFLLMIGFPQGIVVVAFAFFFRSSLMNMCQPLIRGISMDIVEERQRALMSSMRTMTNNITRALGIYIGGHLMTEFSYNTPYLFTIACYLTGTGLFYIVFRDRIQVKQ